MEVELLPEPGPRDGVIPGITHRRTVDCSVCGSPFSANLSGDSSCAD